MGFNSGVKGLNASWPFGPKTPALKGQGTPTFQQISPSPPLAF